MPRTRTLPFARRSTPARASTGPRMPRPAISGDSGSCPSGARRGRHLRSLGPRRAAPPPAATPAPCRVAPTWVLSVSAFAFTLGKDDLYWLLQRDSPIYRYCNGLTKHKASYDRLTNTSCMSFAFPCDSC
jgi:hypothetical protein